MLNKLVAVVPDNTETYFICNDSNYDDYLILHRRMAVCLYESTGLKCKRNDFPAFMDESGRICLYDEEKIGCDIAYDTFTVGVPKYFHEVNFVCRFFDHPERLVSILKQLRAKNFVFIKPQSSVVNLDISDDFNFGKFHFVSYDPCVPIGGLGQNWSFDLTPDEEWKLFRFGRELALFRYAFDMPDLKLCLTFCGDKSNEDLYKAKWERMIEESAEKFAVEYNLK